jgi:hypothetical protein
VKEQDARKLCQSLAWGKEILNYFPISFDAYVKTLFLEFWKNIFYGEGSSNGSN